jgi:phosphoribosylamine--glycine ligase
MDVMVVDGGGRGDALSWKLAQSPDTDRLWLVSGRHGEGEFAETATHRNNRPIRVNDYEAQVRFARQNDVDLAVVCPDNPQDDGLVDMYETAGIRTFGASAKAARLEASKSWMKGVATEAGVPTADYAAFDVMRDAVTYVRSRQLPLYIKADGLARGYGAKPAYSSEEAEQIIARMMDGGEFGEAGRTVVIEEFLSGVERSLHAATDGFGYQMLPVLADDKKRFDGNKGPNTGSMGTVGPMPGLEWSDVERLGEQFIAPILPVMRRRGATVKGMLYPGIMDNIPVLDQSSADRSATAKALEYNVRFGDSEAQVYARHMRSDLLKLVIGCVEGDVENVKLEWNDGYVACVNLVSDGYPGAIQTGFPIEGLEDAKRLPGVRIFHAGTRMRKGRLETAGGRVLNVTAVGATLQEAIARAYEAVAYIHFHGMDYRRDIGSRVLQAVSR